MDCITSIKPEIVASGASIDYEIIIGCLAKVKQYKISVK
jgi:hypothetical protein